MLRYVSTSVLVLAGALAHAQGTVASAGSVNVGMQSAPVSVTVTMAGTGVAGAPQAETQGITTGSDFALAGGGSCAAGTSYSAGATCTAMVTFAPKYPGIRAGAVVIPNGGGGVLGTGYVSGIGIGGLGVLNPGQMDTVVGSSAWLYRADGVIATNAEIFLPMGVVVDAAGNMFIADANNNRIRRVDAATDLISTVGGNGTPGYMGDGGPATAAEISAPSGLALDGAGNLYFVDSGNHAVRRIDAVTGIITTIAGSPTIQGYAGDGGPATSAKLSLPEGLAFDMSGNMLIADTGNNVIRKVDTTGTIHTVAGNTVQGYNGDSQAATSAQLNTPWGVTARVDGSFLIADLNNHRVRSVSAGGTITTVAGVGTQGFSGDDGAAPAAKLNAPAATVVDPAGDIYIADSGNNRVRKIYATSGKIETITGNDSQQFDGDGKPANKASFYGPYALYFDQVGDLLIADMFHNRIRRINALQVPLTYDTIRVSKVSAPQAEGFENDGNATLTINAPAFSNSALDAATTTCNTGSTLAVSIGCNYGVEFAPTVVGDTVNGFVKANSDAVNSPANILLSGQVLTVNPTSVALVSSKNPSMIGDAVIFTATVTSDDTGRSGSVTFTDGATTICNQVALNSNGIAVCSTTALALGAHTITANYSGDANNATATASITQTVLQSTTLALSSSLNPAPVGTNVTFTLHASAATGTPTGNVTFLDGTTALATMALDGSGNASYSTSTLTPGGHSISAKYVGDTNDAPGTSNVVPQQITTTGTTTTISTSNANVPVGTSVTFTANVSSSRTGAVLTGTVTFKDGATTLGTGTLTSGVATYTTSTLAPGAHSIVATYGGDTNDAGSSSSALTETITQIGTTTTLTSDANPANAGAVIHLTAQVAMATGATADGPITGTVTFMDGAASLGTANLNAGGTATLAVSTLAVGSHAIVATYSGNTNYAPSSSSALSQQINATGTTTALTASAQNITVGQSVTFSAAVTSGTGGIPTGTVSFREGAAVVGTGTLNAQGVTTTTTSSLTVGTHIITAIYSGDSNYITSTSNTVTVVVAQAGSSITLASSLNPAVVGQNVTFTASVPASTPAATGTVTFMDGAASLGSVNLTGTGVATFSTTQLAAGQHAITAVYSGDANHSGATSSVVNELIVQQATAAIISSLNPSISGNNVTFTAKISGAGSAAPSGKVTFLDGAATLAVVTLDATGSATYSTSTLAVGTHPITVNYPGDTNYSTATASLTQTVGNASTQVALTASANPAVYGTAEIFTATISSDGGVATGTVTFTDGGTSIGSAQLNAQGIATLTTSTLTPGTHTIIANYAGDGKAGASVSTPLSLVVQQMTTVVLLSSNNPEYTLNPITFTATIKNAGAAVATGTVTFTDGSTNLGTVNVDATGKAAVTVPQMTAGNHPITASYSGDSTNFASTSPVLTQVVQLRPTTTTLSSTQTDPTNPLSVTLISVVHWNGTAAAPTGKVTFKTGSTTIGSVAIDASGVATLTITLSSSTETIVASYNGDVNYASSDSLATDITGGAATQFTMSIDPPNVSLQSKQRATLNLTLSSVKGFTDTMQFGCLGLPYAATCTFSKTAGTLPADGKITVQLVVDTGDPLGSGASTNASVKSNSTGTFLAFLPLGLLGCFAMFRRRKGAVPALLLALFTLALTMGVTGCSGLQTAGTPAGTYTIKVTASGQGTGATQADAMTLTVTQ
jgi:hypothetical protein